MKAIILCGGLMNAGELLLVPTIKSFNENVLHFHKGKVAILRSQLKDGEAAILGASSLFAEGSLLFQDGSTRTPEAHSQKVMLEGHA